jgi:hypothetical protein
MSYAEPLDGVPNAIGSTLESFTKMVVRDSTRDGIDMLLILNLVI